MATTRARFGNLTLDDNKNTAERIYQSLDRDGTLADTQAVSDAVDQSFYSFPTTTSNLAFPANPPEEDYGNSDLTILTVAKIVPREGGTQQIIRAKIDGSSRGFNLYATGATNLRFICINSTGANSQDVSFDATVYWNEKHSFCARRVSASSTTAYADIWVDGNKAATSTTTTRATLSTSTLNYLGYTTDSLFSSQLYRHLEFNYALPEEKIRRYSAGGKLDFDDISGSMAVGLTNPNFEGGFSGGLATGWTKVGANATPSSTTGRDGTGSAQRLTVGATVDNDVGISQATLTAGRSYRARCWVRCSRAGTTVRIQYGSGFTSTSHTIQQANTWEQVVSSRFVADGGTFAAYLDTGHTTGDTIDFDDFIDQVGAVIDLESESIGDSWWVDASKNGLSAAVTGATWPAIGTTPNKPIPLQSTKNYIINGAFDFNQRVANATVDGNWGPDRWFINHNMTSVSLSRVANSTPVSGYNGRLTQTTKGAGTTLYACHSFEASVVRELAGKTITLSCLISRNATLTSGTVLLNVIFGTAGTEKWPTTGSNFSKLISINRIPTSGMSRVSVTGFIPSTTTGIRICIGCNDGTWADGSVLDFSEVMLNIGSVAAPFERAGSSLEGEMSACQRYYEKSYQQSALPGSSETSYGYVFYRAASTSVDWYVPFATSKRITNHTTYVYSTAGSAAGNIMHFGVGPVAASVSVPGPNGILVSKTTAGVIGDAYGCHWTADAEIT